MPGNENQSRDERRVAGINGDEEIVGCTGGVNGNNSRQHHNKKKSYKSCALRRREEGELNTRFAGKYLERHAQGQGDGCK